MELITYVLFAALGVAFGYGLRSGLAYLALLAPVLLYLGALAANGFEVGALIELMISLVVVVLGILAGWALGDRLESDEQDDASKRSGESRRPSRSGA